MRVLSILTVIFLGFVSVGCYEISTSQLTVFHTDGEPDRQVVVAIRVNRLTGEVCSGSTGTFLWHCRWTGD
jgi:hypothetical protein